MYMYVCIVFALLAFLLYRKLYKKVGIWEKRGDIHCLKYYPLFGSYPGMFFKVNIIGRIKQYYNVKYVFVAQTCHPKYREYLQ